MAGPNLPTTAYAIRIAILFHRKLTTAWSDKEVKAYKKLRGQFEDLLMIEEYYAAERKKGENGIHRRELYTFLNNYQGEADKARAWSGRNKWKKQNRPKNVTNEMKVEVSDEDFLKVRDMVRTQMEQFKQQMRQPASLR